MKLPKKTKKCFVSDIHGAVIISRNTGQIKASVGLAIIGIIKKHGCVMFHPKPWSQRIHLNRTMCQVIYFDWPKTDEAWLVVPKSWGYEWTRIDGEIEVS